MVALHLLRPSPRVIPSPWNFAGLVLILLGLTFNIQLSGLYGRRGTTIKPFREPSAFLAGGHYAYSRNPMYLWMIIALLGLFMLLGSLLPLIVPPLFAVLLNYRFVVHEEDAMTQRFGEEYVQYRRRVRRWL